VLQLAWTGHHFPARGRYTQTVLSEEEPEEEGYGVPEGIRIS